MRYQPGLYGAAPAAPAIVTPVFFALGTQANASFADITPPLPAGWATGDLHLAVVMGQRSSAMVDTTVVPAGWTRASSLTIISGQRYKVEVHYRVAQAGDGNPTFDTSVWSTTVISAAILGFRHCRAATPFESYTHLDVTASDTTPAYANITTSGPSQRVANLFITGNVEGAPGAGWTEEFDFAATSPNSQWQLDTKEMLSAGLASGTHTLTDLPGFCHRVSFAMVPA